ncbi:hypothetical protein BO85DRAFT_463260 [Aspergillus piperis CBS 112811]|uniref:Uncharacterized protein n=1 Tax=Aspergillus piperis CBS 112811 TaxID=1448313 RepID=A0A8G1QTD1_9EURO|nr:hypothetical protein BO85DRAFT_463260 [Aspergillus piperis CBS 112811]RAH53298.1 hypothetical protein BO85DRAFT_463260 [Aspergillus piperis CBS 112811]
MGDTSSCLQGWRIPTYQMFIPQQACCTLIELPVRIMTTEGYHDCRGGPPYAVWLLRNQTGKGQEYYRITLGRYHSIRSCVLIWTPTRSPITHLAVPPESDPFGPRLTTFSPFHCGDSYSYRGEHLIPHREFLSPLISSFFVAVVKPASSSMRLNTYPGLKQGSTEPTTENLSAEPNIQAFPVKSLTNLIRGDGRSSALGGKVKPSQKQNKELRQAKRRTKNLKKKKASLGSVICKSIGHVRPEHS